MDSYSKGEIEKFQKAIQLVITFFPSLAPKQAVFQQKMNDLLDDDNLYTLEGIDALFYEWKQLGLPDVDSVFEVKEYVDAYAYLKAAKKIDFNKGKSFIDRIANLKKSGKIFSENGVYDLRSHWRRLGLPKIAEVSVEAGKRFAPGASQAEKINRDTQTQYINSTPEDYKEIVKDQIDLVRKITKKDVDFLPQGSKDTTDYTSISPSVVDLVKNSLQRISEYTKSTAVLK